MMQSLRTLLTLSNNVNTLQDCSQLTCKCVISNDDHEQNDHNDNNNQIYHENAMLTTALKSHLMHHHQHDSMRSNNNKIVTLNMLQQNDQEAPCDHFYAFIIKLSSC